MSTNFITSAVNIRARSLARRNAELPCFQVKKDGKVIIFCGLKKSFIPAVFRLSGPILRKIGLSCLNWRVNLSDTNG
jgi:hypothetical protein